MIKKDRSIDANHERREFLKRVSSLALGGALLNTLAGCSTGLASYFVRSSGSRINLSLHEHPELETIGGAVEIEFTADPEVLIVVRTGADSAVALSSKCTHLGCTVRKEPSFFRCPCHGSTYTLEGDVVRGPAEFPLDRYNAKIEGNEIIITLQIVN